MIHLKSTNRNNRRFAVLVEPNDLDGKPIRNDDMLYAAVIQAKTATVRMLAIDFTPGELVTMTPQEFINEWQGD